MVKVINKISAEHPIGKLKKLRSFAVPELLLNEHHAFFSICEIIFQIDVFDFETESVLKNCDRNQYRE